MLHLYSGNSMEALATRLLGHLARPRGAAPADVFARRDCVVIPSKTMEGWIRQQAMFASEATRGPRVLADCDFALVNVFVNDWLHRMDNPQADRRDPAAHPFSRESLRWRIFRRLRELGRQPDPEYAALSSFLPDENADPAAGDRRRFQLADRLAAVFDGYTVSRPETLAAWSRNQPMDEPERLTWQRKLWHELTADDLRERTYVAAFLRMVQPGSLAQSGIAGVYRSVHVFCPALLHRVYQLFLICLAEALDVHLYVFSPSRLNWLADELTGKRDILREQTRPCLDAADEDDSMSEKDHPLLAKLGRGAHEFLSELLDLTGGNLEAGAQEFAEPGRETCLKTMQQNILENQGDTLAGDPSIQTHVCHNPRREVEELRDGLLRLFTDNKWQPRDVQVQVPDLSAYAPYIEAVFSSTNPHAPAAIPFTLADRTVGEESPVSEGFLQLLDLAERRFTATEVMELLQCESLGRSFGIGPDDMERVAELIEAAGIRWGVNADHREAIAGVAFDEATAWRHGLDRLLKGYALGDAGSGHDPNPPLACDVTEGEDTLLLGRLATFVETLGRTTAFCRQQHALNDWQAELEKIVSDFFVSDNRSYKDVGQLRMAVRALAASAAAAEAADLKVGVREVRLFLQAHLQGATAGGAAHGNTVVFCTLRPGSSVPRKAICLLGMNDGEFPRPDRRPAYDLLKIKRKRGDRTPRVDDRTAFLEALLCARELFYASYVGYEADGAERYPSILIREMQELLAPNSACVVKHRLQAYHPDYFSRQAPTGRSYSHRNLEAAKRYVQRLRGEDDKTKDRDAAAGAVPKEQEYLQHPLRSNGPAPATTPTVLCSLRDLCDFFRNPALYYYEKTLGLRLRERTAAAIADTEEFDPDSLAGYKVREALRDAFAETDGVPPDQDALRRRLTEQGMLPLGDWGKRWFSEKWEQMQELMNAALANLDTLAAALGRQARERRSLDTMIEIGAVALQGQIYVYGPEPSPVTIQYRPAKPAAKNKIAPWLEHVFACAVGAAHTGHILEARTLSNKANEYAHALLPPIEKEDAQGILKECLALLEAGRQRPLPLTPQASHNYAEALYGDPKKDPEPDAEAKAKKQAKQGWGGSGSDRYGEHTDEAMQRAFGPEGPMDKPRFDNYATIFWKPYFQNREIQKSGVRN